nr:anthocyanidin 3-o-glucoside 2''-o-glucosyltransferase [Quercus suber]
MKPHGGGNYPHKGGSEGHTEVEEYPHGVGSEGHTEVEEHPHGGGRESPIIDWVKPFKMSDKSFHIVMYPWFAMGHLTSILHISNKLAERGHRVSFLLPTNTQAKLEPFNLHKNLISFIPITVPHVDGLPPGSETTSDVPFPLHSLIMTAMDLTAPSTEYFLRDLKPHFVFHDFTHWLPQLARRLGIKSIHHCIISPATVGYLLSPERKINEKPLTEADFKAPPPSFPPSSIKLFPHEVRQVTSATLKQFGRGI